MVRVEELTRTPYAIQPQLCILAIVARSTVGVAEQMREYVDYGTTMNLRH